jgi:hypothetical protein
VWNGEFAGAEKISVRKVRAFVPGLLAALAVSGAVPAEHLGKLASEDSWSMKQDELKYGKPNPNAPPELSRFAFLIGQWSCEAKLRHDDGTWETLKATWEGRYILDGYAIADEYRMTTAAGQLMVLGMNFRSYDAKAKTWNLKWLNALSGTWTDLGAKELGGLTMNEKAITLVMKEPSSVHAFTRATYTNFSGKHFTWRGERSNDGKSWEEFLVIECGRN